MIRLTVICRDLFFGINRSMAKQFSGEDIREIFGKNLRYFRDQKNLSQVALSCKAGLAHNFVNDVENRKKWVSPETISKLVSVLDVEPYQLFTTNPLDSKQTSQINKYLDELNERFSEAVGEIKASYFLTSEKFNE